MNLVKSLKIRTVLPCSTLSMLLLFGCSQPTNTTDDAEVKNIIFIVGDGMGLSQVSAAFYLQEDSSNFWRFPVVGIHQCSSTSKITDSAAGATAFSTGETTYNGAIAVDQDSAELETILEKLSAEGWKSGVIATSSIQHATPASFYAHVNSRRKYEEISEDLVSSDVDFFAGGGIQFFTERSDGVNLFDQLLENGFEWDTTQLGSNLDADKKYGYLLAPDGMPPMLEGRGNFLTDASELALNYLTKTDNPFLLVIEGSQIDWGGHGRDAEYIRTEMIDFDKMLGAVLDFAEADRNTLVVVTADHETGGYSLSSGDSYDEIVPTFSTGGHTATLIPVFAFGPGAENFGGIYKNTEIYRKMLASLK